MAPLHNILKIFMMKLIKKYKIKIDKFKKEEHKLINKMSKKNKDAFVVKNENVSLQGFVPPVILNLQHLILQSQSQIIS